MSRVAELESETDFTMNRRMLDNYINSLKRGIIKERELEESKTTEMTEAAGPGEEP